MNYIILGAAGFIGVNLTKQLSKEHENRITVVDRDLKFFEPLRRLELTNVSYEESSLSVDEDFESLLKGQEVVFHLVSTTFPTTSNQAIAQELEANVIMTTKLLEACVKTQVKKVVFISSGGTVYGKETKCPLREDTPTNPISSYGVQKLTIEKLLYLYNYMYGLDYRVARLANPYGPYQRPNGLLGAATTFTFKALMNEEINVYGDGSVVRDYIYIDDAIRGILNIMTEGARHRVYNIGCGYGTSIKELLEIIQEVLGKELAINYLDGRKVDVPVNYLNIERYEKEFGSLNSISLREGIKKTAEFLSDNYME